MKRVALIVLALTLLMSCFAPIAAAEDLPAGTPSRADMRGHGSIEPPRKDAWLPAYEIRYVCASGGVAAYLFSAPRLYDQDLIIDTVFEGTQLLLLAEQDDFYLVKMDDHRLGWICVGLTSETRELLDSVPELLNTCWIYRQGSAEKDGYAVKFGEKRLAEARDLAKGSRVDWGWTITARRVYLDKKYFIWDGEQFVSRDLYETPEGKIRYYLLPDTEGLFDQLSAE